MNEIIRLPARGGDDRLWAVLACAGKTQRVAEVFASRDAALADCRWREAQVAAYRHFLRNSRNPVPAYTVTRIRRSDLPKSWRPLPALGLLHGQMA